MSDKSNDKTPPKQQELTDEELGEVAGGSFASLSSVSKLDPVKSTFNTADVQFDTLFAGASLDVKLDPDFAIKGTDQLKR